MKCLTDDTAAKTPHNSMASNNSPNKAMSNSSNHTVSDSVANSNSLRVDSSALVGHLSHVSVNIVGVVVDVLDAAIRKVDRVGSLPSSSAIVGLRSLKASSRVVVGHSVLVGVRGDLVRVHLCHSMTHNRMANANTMSNANTVAYSNSVSDPSKELRGGRCSSCQGRNDQRSLHVCCMW